MRRGSLPAFLWVLGGLLLLGWLAIALSSSEAETFPSADSRAPSGMAGFVELLQREGYRVRIDRSARPRLRQDEIGIFPLVANIPSGSFIQEHVAAGGRALLLPLASRFDDASRAAEGATNWINDAGDSLETTPLTDHFDLADSKVALPQSDGWVVWYDENMSAAELVRFDDGVTGTLADGLVATNRFLDQRDNAALLVNFVQWLAPRGASLVFVEASFGNGHEQGLLALIGPWADAAGWQATLLFVVIVWTLGKRFGLPESVRTRQKGARELVDGIGQIYDRSGATPLALEAAASSADVRIRAHFKLPRDAPKDARNRAVPTALADALAAVEHAASLRPPTRQALELVRALDRELERALKA